MTEPDKTPGNNSAPGNNPAPGSKSAPGSPGTVCLVGAGPGDPGLITARGLDRLRQAQVLVFDALVDPSLLDEAPPHAQRIDAGKRARLHKLTQDQINDLLVAKAREGKFVVRLKGGDPYLFGRGAEEAAYLARHGITCEIIPGVTSGIAAPAMAGIPVTHRKFASTVTLVTGHEDPTKPETAIDYQPLADLVRAAGTVCLYMGVSRLAHIAEQFVAHNLPGDTPAAVVQWGTTPRQRSVRGTLTTIAKNVEHAGIAAPAIIVIGPVAGIDEPGLDHFTRRPLFGTTLLITRTRQQASDLRHKLADLGARVLEAPTIELVAPPPEVLQQVDDALRDIKHYDWLVLTSGNGVEALAARLAHMNLDARHLSPVRIAAIGDATADAFMHHLRIRPDLVPTKFVGESLAAELIAKHDVKGKRLLLFRADIARPALPKLVKEAGAIVTEIVIYQTKPAAALPEDVLTALKNGEIDWVTFTSSSTAQNLADLLGADRNLLTKVKLASIGPITTQTLRDLGFPPTIEAIKSDIEGLVTALVAAGKRDAAQPQHGRNE